MNNKIGKVIAETVYIHAVALDCIELSLSALVRDALSICAEAAPSANVFKIDIRNRAVSLLNYPDFFEQPFPELSESWRIDLEHSRVSYRSYDESLNPPILHRKELLLPSDHPRRGEYENLTAQAEQIGLFSDATTIGFRRTWEARIRQAGYCLVGHSLQPLGNDVADTRDDEEFECGIQRYRTALSRSGLSAPMQALARHGLLDEQYSYFDYGCGRGDDLQALRKNGLVASGWDPHFALGEPKLSADIVNLGFVVNVIEDFDERVDALRGAFSLAKQLLVVSTMLYAASIPAGRPFRDGYLTQRNTFQKYFTQSELKEFVETVLDTVAIPVAPGIVFVFSDKEAEQRFLYGRQRSHYASRLLGYRRERQSSVSQVRSTRVERLVSEHGALIGALWERMLELGRDPGEDEFHEYENAIRVFGSWGKALRFVQSVNDAKQLEVSRSQRNDDIVVYLALQLFARRKPYRRLDVTLQRDIKSHFGDYQRAQAVAQRYLLDIADPATLEAACAAASAKGLGHYVSNDYLQLHTSLIEQLPALLRIYIGCGSLLYGDLDDVDLVKIHVRSSKVTFMKFDDFEGLPLPRMLERIKVTLRSQEINFFMYGSSYEPPLLYYKSRFINEDFPKYGEQLAFDEALSELTLFDPNTYGPSERELQAELTIRRLEVREYGLCGATSLPKLDEPCGRNFTYRDLIECGETWRRTGITNRPRNPETYNALHALTTRVIDPLIDYFGMIRLTYGFCSPELAKAIPARIAPKLDQHAAHEHNRFGQHICDRLGAAVDFVVEDEDMVDVAKWIAENLVFDRLYLYGPDRPIHISYGPEMLQQVTIMVTSKTAGRLIPRTITLDAFRDFSWRVATSS
ncbi:MAG: DNA phosphorothioation-associated putative methyltransferase [Fimbriimonadaceae bacterium]|nr:DNA phosphorothioation-associated putative methyltransferase [Fimbriimonadaceae bacterium]